MAEHDSLTDCPTGPPPLHLLQNVLQALPVGVWIMDHTGRITHGNPAGRRIWGGARYIAICAGCKKIRDDTGRWRGVEAYVEDRSTVQFSHGNCPDCMRRIYVD
jgi:hypothetical protein